jgi:hypothetical protein
MMDKVQKNNLIYYNTPLSETFRLTTYLCLKFQDYEDTNTRQKRYTGDIFNMKIETGLKWVIFNL